MSMQQGTLTPQELRIMKIVWRLKRATVRDVHDALCAQRAIAYTTVMTLMRILETKGYLEKSAQERAYVYRPTRRRDHVMAAMVREFLDRVFDGAPQGLLLHLAKAGRLTAEQRRLVKTLLEEVNE